METIDEEPEWELPEKDELEKFDQPATRMPHGKFKGKLYCEIMRDNPEYAVDLKEAHTCSAGWKPKCPMVMIYCKQCCMHIDIRDRDKVEANDHVSRKMVVATPVAQGLQCKSWMRARSPRIKSIEYSRFIPN